MPSTLAQSVLSSSTLRLKITPPSSKIRRNELSLYSDSCPPVKPYFSIFLLCPNKIFIITDIKFKRFLPNAILNDNSCIENNKKASDVTGMLITNTELSDTAKKMASFLGIQYLEKYDLEDYPCIKCNINYNEYGEKTYIYHLPFDQMYDQTKIDRKKGEFFAVTVAEAEEAGFRRAHKWFGNR